MSTPLVLGVDATAVTVSEMPQALAFYCSLLGLRVADRKGLGADWVADELERWHAYHEKVCGIPGARIEVVFLEAPDGTHLELIAYANPPIRPSRRRMVNEPGVAIVPLLIRDSLDVVNRLRKANIEVLADPQHYVLDGVESYTTYVSDPDGNMLCLFEVVEPS